jgi:hypothetical protein
MTASEYWQEVELLSIEVEDAIAVYQTYEEINRLALENQEIFAALNRDALFWKVQAYTLQTSLIIVLGRIFDTADDAHSVHKIVAATILHIEFFSRDALGERRRSSGLTPRDLENFVSTAWVPNGGSDLEHLRNALSAHTKQYKKVYLPIRNKLFAHRLMNDAEAVAGLFAPTNRAELGSILDFLHDLMDAIEQLYLNGREPELGTRVYDAHNQRIRDGVKNVLGRIAASYQTLADKSQNVCEEYRG